MVLKRGSKQENDGDCEEDQDGDPWSLLVDLYTCGSSL
jgi:hypothetical protein